MEVCPDFGYEGDNFCLEKDEDAPRNWKLLTEIISSKSKHEWLKNHIALQSIRKEQEKEEQERKKKKDQHMMQIQLAMKVAIVEMVDKKPKNVLDPSIHKEMAALKKSVKSSKEMFDDFLEKRGRDGRNFEKSGRNKSLSYVSNSSNRYQTLVQRQKEYTEKMQIKRALSSIGIHRDE